MLVLSLRGGGNGRPMGIAAGGKIKQTIVEDKHDPAIWDSVTIPVLVHILDSTAFRSATGRDPPPCPISASTYKDVGLPFFDMYEEPSAAYGAFEAVKSVSEIEQERGLADRSEPSVKPNIIKIGKDGHVIPTAGHVDLSGLVDDRDGLLSPAGPLREFRTLADLRRELESPSLDSKDNTNLKGSR